MPLYSFRCGKCHEYVVVRLKMDEERPSIHDGCGGPLVRQFTPINVIYRAGGFTTTDKRLDKTDDDE